MGYKAKSYSSYINSHKFLEFLSREFDLTARHATVEEFAEFAFGSMRAAVEAFEEYRKPAKSETLPL